jgi:hypothetical protein
MLRRHLTVAIAIAVIVAGVPRAALSQEPSPHKFGKGPLGAVKKAARFALGESYTCMDSGGAPGERFTENSLSAVMLAISYWELASGASDRAISPLALSRADTWAGRADGSNHVLYSHNTLPDYKRAHYSSGAGLWQIDNYTDWDQLNTGQRIDAYVGGQYIARYLRDANCKGTLDERIKNRWYGCWDESLDLETASNYCLDKAAQLYVPSSDTLDVEPVDAVWQRDGGATFHACKFSRYGDDWMLCRFINTTEGVVQGEADLADPEGTGSRNPLAFPFLSVTWYDNDRSYALWLRAGTHWEGEPDGDQEVVREVPYGLDARQGGQWYNDTLWQVCRPLNDGSGKCSPSEDGLDPSVTEDSVNPQ